MAAEIRPVAAPTIYLPLTDTVSLPQIAGEPEKEGRSGG